MTFLLLKWLVLLTFTGIHAQEPRKRSRFSFEEPLVLEQTNEDVSCSVGGCVKRSPGQDEFGPFWANRGKKDPTYARNKFYVEEPHWILVRRDEMNNNEPFFVTRGKKNLDSQFWKKYFSGKKIKYLQNSDGSLSMVGRNGDRSVEVQ